jgi:O-antigen/teichoic acid export membrane protein
MKIFEPTIPKQGLSLKANFSWTLVGNIVYRFSQWGLVVILAKLTSPESVGQYTLALAITTPVYMFCNLGLTVVQTTDADDHNIFGEYLGLRIITSLFALVFIAGILILGPYESYMISVLAIVSLTKYVESISDAAHGLMQKQEHLDLVAQSLIIRGVASLLTFLTLLDL